MKSSTTMVMKTLKDPPSESTTREGTTNLTVSTMKYSKSTHEIELWLTKTRMATPGEVRRTT